MLQSIEWIRCSSKFVTLMHNNKKCGHRVSIYEPSEFTAIAFKIMYDCSHYNFDL